MTWKTFFLILLIIASLTALTLRSITAQKKTHKLIAKQAYLIACAELKSVRECRPLADKYLKEYVK